MLILDTGIVTVSTITDTPAAPGLMPKRRKTLQYKSFFADRTIGYGRAYAAKGVSQQVDRLIRVEYHPETQAGWIATIDNIQFRVDLVQHGRDDDTGLLYTDLTLARLDGDHDVTN